MIKLIGLDESGEFEATRRDIRFVGGYTAKLKDRAEIEQFRKTVEKELADYCENFNNRYNLTQCVVHYPKSLHGSGNIFYKNLNSLNAFAGISLSGNGNNQNNNIVDPSTVDKIPNYKENFLDTKPSGCNKKYRTLEKEFTSGVYELFYKLVKRYNMELFVYLYPDRNVQLDRILDMETSNAISIDNGINLYERMINQAINHEIFYDIKGSVDAYALAFATRSKKLDSSTDSNFKSKLADLYESNKNIFYITNPSTYKTAVSTKLFEGNVAEEYLNKDYFFDVKSINYYEHDNTQSKARTPLHYLSDIACGIVRDAAKELNANLDYWTNDEVKSLSKTLADRLGIDEAGINLMVYDVEDSKLLKLVSYAKELELDRYYEEKYLLDNMNSRYTGYYMDKLIPMVDEYIDKKLQITDNCHMVIGKLQQFYSYTDGMMGVREMECEKGAYVAESLLKLIPKLGIRNQTMLGKYIFRFNDILIRANNHRGDVKNNLQLISICETYKKCVGLEEYIDHTLRVAQYYFNTLKFQKVIDIYRPLTMDKFFVKDLNAYSKDEVYRTEYSGISRLKQVYNDIFAGVNDVNDMLDTQVEQMYMSPQINIPFIGRIYGTLTQAHGYLGGDLAIKNGESAVAEFADDAANASITMCHMLHVYLDRKDKDEYEKNAGRYYGTWDEAGNYDGILDFQLKQAATDRGGFALYLYIKAFNLFYADDENNVKYLKEFYQIAMNVGKYVTDVHPWELIYKNLYEAMQNRREHFSQEAFDLVKAEAMKKYRNEGATIELLQINFKLNSLDEDVELEDKDVELLKLFFDVPENIDSEYARELLGKKLTYEYV